MHTVIASLCTGCDLCVPPCPVDCIDMQAATPGRTGWDAWSQVDADAARARHDARTSRLQREKQENDARLAAKAIAKLAEVDASNAQTDAERAEKERKRAIIQAAIERSRQQKEAAQAVADEKKP
jgi:electron transport complex protein RnfB